LSGLSSCRDTTPGLLRLTISSALMNSICISFLRKNDRLQQIAVGGRVFILLAAHCCLLPYCFSSIMSLTFMSRAVELRSASSSFMVIILMVA